MQLNSRWREMTRLCIVITALFSLSFKTPAFAAPSSDKGTSPGQQTVAFAHFPLAIPVGVLGEALKRDKVLHKELERLGAKVDFRSFAKGSDAIPLVRKNQVDAIMSSDIPCIDGAVTGDMQIVGTIKRSYAAVVARQGTQVDKLRNRKIGNAFASTSHYALSQALASVGLSEKEVTIVPMDANEMPDALVSGKVAAIAAWEPTPTAVLKKYPGQFAVIYRQASNSYMSLSRRMIDEHPAVADALAAAVARAIRWMKKGSNLTTASSWALQGMRDYTGKDPYLTAEDIASITRKDLLEAATVPTVVASEKQAGSVLGREFDFLKGIGKIPADASKERFLSAIRTDLMQRILADPVRHKLNRFDYMK